jgi:dTMP kinase
MSWSDHKCNLEWVSGNPCDASYECLICNANRERRKAAKVIPPEGRPGKLIVIEGIDGSGKETQTRLLVDWIKHHLGKNVSTFDFPSYHRSPFGRIIGRYLKGDFGDPVTMDPFETALLYAGDRMHAKMELVEPLNRGNTVVLNRYVPSNLAYGCAKLCYLDRHEERDELVTFNRQVEYEAAGLPRPDMVVVLDVESSVASDLIGSKAPRQYLEGEERDKYELNTRFQRLVRQEYRRLALVSDGWHIVQCTEKQSQGNGPRSIEEIQEELRHLVAKISKNAIASKNDS